MLGIRVCWSRGLAWWAELLVLHLDPRSKVALENLSSLLRCGALFDEDGAQLVHNGAATPPGALVATEAHQVVPLWHFPNLLRPANATPFHLAASAGLHPQLVSDLTVLSAHLCNGLTLGKLQGLGPLLVGHVPWTFNLVLPANLIRELEAGEIQTIAVSVSSHFANASITTADRFLENLAVFTIIKRPGIYSKIQSAKLLRTLQILGTSMHQCQC
mmetsp:Transcript_23279/g.39999  ORF Transcript_23279/g.39999 Transcript_23279/m.39999 type:complete len:216 (-) Transcript_23279:38-685(-)